MRIEGLLTIALLALAERALHELDALPARQLDRKQIVAFLASLGSTKTRQSK